MDLVVANARTDEEKTVDIGIKDGIIVKIGKITEKSKKRIDARGNAVVPGFVNIHTHLDKADLLSKMSRSQFGGTLEQNRELLKGFKRDYTIQNIKERARPVILEMVAHGCTAIRTQVDVDSTGGLVPLKALTELKEELKDVVTLQICAFPQEGVLKPGTRERLEEAAETADVIGGLPLIESDPDSQKEHVDILFEVAKKNNRDLEIQIDESNDPSDFLLPYLAQKTIDEGYEGRVSATHCISLSAVDDETAQKTIDLVKKAAINIIVTPSANLITRFPDVKRRPYNSITRVKELLEAGINVAIGTDNIRDIFFPLGNCSMLREMHCLATTTRMTAYGDEKKLFDMASVNGARIMGLGYGIAEGNAADLIVLNKGTLLGALDNLAFIPYVIKHGRLVSSTLLNTKIEGR